MALTDAQKADVRRFGGYPAVADTLASDTRDTAYVHTFAVWTTLFHRLNNLSVAEEAILVDVYLTNLTVLESDVLTVRDTIDTTAAGTWQSNPLEMSQRIRLFNKWRRDMCAFLGLEPGPSLGTSGMNIVRG